MKKVIAGIGLFLTGFLSIILMSCLTVTSVATINEKYPFIWSIFIYGLTPLFVLSVIFTILGLSLIAWGLIEK